MYCFLCFNSSHQRNVDPQEHIVSHIFSSRGASSTTYSNNCREPQQVLFEDTEHEGDEGHQGHPHPQVADAVLLLRLGQSVGQRRLETHKQHAAWKSHSGPDVVQHFGKIHLEINTQTENASETIKAQGKCKV